MRWQGLFLIPPAICLIVGCQSGPSPLARAAAPEAPASAEDSSSTIGHKPEASQSNSPIRRTVFESSVEPFPKVPDGQLATQIRAHVNGVAILDDEVRETVYPFLVRTMSLSEPQRTTQQNEIFRQGIQQIIDREVILQDALARLSKNGPQFLDKLKAAAGTEFDRKIATMKKAVNLKTDEDLKNYLQGHGLSLEGMRRQAEREFIAQEYLRNRVFSAVERATGHQQILAYYEEHAAEFLTVDSVKWQDIFIDASRYRDRDEARHFAHQLAARARAGEDFKKLAQFDNGDSSYRNGDGIGEKHNEIRPVEAENYLFNMKDGEIGPVIELPTGFHVIRLVKRQFAGKLPLDDNAQTTIKKKLQREVYEKEYKRFVADLRQKATIEIAGGSRD